MKSRPRAGEGSQICPKPQGLAVPEPIEPSNRHGFVHDAVAGGGAHAAGLVGHVLPAASIGEDRWVQGIAIHRYRHGTQPSSRRYRLIDLDDRRCGHPALEQSGRRRRASRSWLTAVPQWSHGANAVERWFFFIRRDGLQAPQWSHGANAVERAGSFCLV